MSKTLGEVRIRIDYNTTDGSYIDAAKHAAAKLIDLINQAKPDAKWDNEQLADFDSYRAIAIHDIETASMFVTKAMTV